MLSIGVIAGGPETRGTCIGNSIARLMKEVAEEREHFEVGSSAALNVVFHIPGSVLRDLDYEGALLGKFAMHERMLMIQVAVPKEIANCRNDEAVARLLFDSLHEANRIAAEYFRKKRIEYSQPTFLALVNAVEKRFSSP